MNFFTQLMVIGLSAALTGGLLALSRRSRPTAGGAGPQTFRVHRVWFIFCALGGGFLFGLSLFLSGTAEPGERAGPAWAAVIVAAFFAFFAFMLRTISATVDGDQLTVRTLHRVRTVALREVESVQTVGMCIEVRLKAPVGSKPPPPLVFLAALRGLGELSDRIRAGSGGAATGQTASPR